mgnify:CR=1 FL=1
MKIKKIVRKKHSAKAWIASVAVFIFLVIDLLPLYFVAVNSLKDKEGYLQNVYNLPSEIHLENYAKLLSEYDFPRMFFNSLVLTVLTVVICGYLGTMASFAVGKFRFRGRKLVELLILPLMSIPSVVLLIPLFVLFSKIGMTNSFLPTILIYVGLLMPFTINMLTSFMSSISNSLLEAAMLDGSGFFKMFNHIVLPLVAPGLSAASIVNAMWIWNELLIAFVFLQDEGKRTLIIGLTSLQGLFNLDVPLLMSGAAVTSLPVIILYLLSQKWFIRGLTVGGVK